ncbi:MAG: hypothetical protein AAF456_25775 [Planctomycetota bacterium]
MKSSRRSFLGAMAGPFLLPCFSTELNRPRLYVQAHDWLDIPYEEQLFEVVGSINNGFAPHPQLGDALIRVAEKTAGVCIYPEDVKNIALVNGCGLFTVYICDFPRCRKYRLWNYHESCSPEYDVIRAGI